jgi:hypothetical protein
MKFKNDKSNWLAGPLACFWPGWLEEGKTADQMMILGFVLFDTWKEKWSKLPHPNPE